MFSKLGLAALVWVPAYAFADPCEVNHIYRPSRDVVPADVEDNSGLFSDDVTLNLTAPPQRFAPNSKAFGEVNMGTATINLKDNSVTINGKTIRDAERDVPRAGGIPCPPERKP